MIVGITGGFGSGKTTVANMFGKYGFHVIDVDKLYHNIYKRNLILKFRIKKEFGTLDRNKIKKIIFYDNKKLRKLNQITHPTIIKAVKKEINKIKKNNEKFKNKIKIIIDVPLLFEAKMEKMFDKIIVVKCNKKTQINRILNKGKYSKIEIEQIWNSQMPIEEKINKADFVVSNEKSIKNAQNQIIKIINSIEQKP